MAIIALTAEPDPTKCRRCNATMEQEPGAAHCRMCGRVYYYPALHLAQLAFERMSGLVTGPTFNRRAPAPRRYYNSARDASS